MLEQSRFLKASLWLLLVIGLVAFTFILVSEGDFFNKTTSDTTPITETKVPVEAGTQTKTKAPAETSTQMVAPVTTKTLPIEDVQKQFKTIQDQVNTGTISVEEAKKQMTEIGTRMAPPPIPADAKK